MVLKVWGMGHDMPPWCTRGRSLALGALQWRPELDSQGVVGTGQGMISGEGSSREALGLGALGWVEVWNMDASYLSR